MTWLKLDIGIIDNPVWRDGLGLRLWLWLLCRAKSSHPEGVVRFSYPVVANQLEFNDGHRLCRPNRQSLRRALRRLVRDGRVVVDEWRQGPEQARIQGGSQGYVTVRLCNWETYQSPRARTEQGGDAGAAPGVHDSRTNGRYTKKRETEKRQKNSGVAIRRVAQKRSSREQLAHDLAKRLGSSIAPCRQQIQALLSEGWTEDRVRAAVEEFGTAGLSPWDWTRRAKGMAGGPGGRGKLTPRDLLSLAERAREIDGDEA